MPSLLFKSTIRGGVSSSTIVAVHHEPQAASWTASIRAFTPHTQTQFMLVEP